MTAHAQSSARRAKLFMNGRSQAVRLPAEFRFEGEEVLIRRDARSGEVVLTPVAQLSWAEFEKRRNALLASLTPQERQDVDEFLTERDQPADGPKDPHEGWHE